MKPRGLSALGLAIVLFSTINAAKVAEVATTEMDRYCNLDEGEISEYIYNGVSVFAETGIPDDRMATTQQPNDQRTPRSFPACPRMCFCQKGPNMDIITVDCSHRNLTYVPRLPTTSQRVFLQRNEIDTINCSSFSGLKNLKILDLSGNNITSLPDSMFDNLNHLLVLNISNNTLQEISNRPLENLTSLEILDLSHNSLIQIKNATFSRLKNLTCLSLKFNQLSYVPSAFESNAFGGLYSLRALQLHGNQRDFPENFTYPDEALSHLSSLEILTLDGHPKPLGPGFSSLINLTALTFGEPGSACNMQLTKLPEPFFYYINTSRPLNISLNNCNISLIPPDVFRYTPTIYGLSLDNNIYLHFDGFENGSVGLRSSNLTALSINRIVDDKSGSRQYLAIETTFKNLPKTKLKTLTLESNYLNRIHFSALRDLPPTLEHLSLFHNNLPSYAVLSNLVILKNLRVLQISEQNIFSTASKITRRLGSRREARLNRNETITSDRTIQDSNVCGGHIAPNIVLLPKRLEELYFNYAKGDINNYRGLKIINNNVLKIYEYSWNSVHCIGGAITGVDAVRRVDLSRNIIEKVSNETFANLTSLETLLLGQNSLGQCLADDVDGVIFSHLHKLETLDLHSNAIKDLSSKAFANQSRLLTLDLSQNQLSFFRPSLSNNAKLLKLDLSTNILTGLSALTCDQLKRLKSLNSSFQVNIADNRFTCECANLVFLSLLVSHRDIFSDIESFNCRLGNGKTIAYSHLESYLPILGTQCLIESLFVYELIIFFLVLMALGILSMFYFKRWQWRYLHYLGQTRLHIGATYFIPKQQKDAFVTYNQDDDDCRWLMRYKFLPKLDQLGLSIVFGETDFVGQPIASSAACAVASTKKTLVLFSKDMFEDVDREFEVNLVIMHELHLRKPVLVPVLMLNTDVDQFGNIERNDLHVYPTRRPSQARDDQLSIVDYREQQCYEPWMDNFTHCLTGEELVQFDKMLASFPPEISVYLQGQGHRCIVYDGGSQEFWTNLRCALLSEDY